MRAVFGTSTFKRWKWEENTKELMMAHAAFQIKLGLNNSSDLPEGALEVKPAILKTVQRLLPVSTSAITNAE
jgi:hypothetical protein